MRQNLSSTSGEFAQQLFEIPASYMSLSLATEARFIVPDWGDKVDYGTGLSTTMMRSNTCRVRDFRLLTTDPAADISEVNET